MNPPLQVSVSHLFQVPQLRPAVAGLIHHAFWTEVPGASVDTMAARLQQASHPDRVPLCLVALHGGSGTGEPAIWLVQDASLQSWIWKLP